MALSNIASALGESTSLAKGIGLTSVVCRLTKGEGGCDCFLLALRDALLNEDLGFDCCGLLSSRSFVFLDVCRHCITVLDGRLSLAFVRAPVDADRVCDRAFGAELALGLWRRFEMIRR